MRIGCVREIKEDEYRVGISPESAKAYIEHGHEVWIEKEAGLGSGFTDEMYQHVGAYIKDNPHEIWSQVDMMVKVKEPIQSEYDLLKEDSILFTYLHLAADEPLTKALLDKRVNAVAYETIQYPGQGLPLLRPMSIIAGRLAAQEGAKYLEKTYGGKGILLSSVDGTDPAEVIVVGSGNVAQNAIKIAHGMGANIHVVGAVVSQLQDILAQYPQRLSIHESSPEIIESLIPNADLIILSALVVGAAAPKIITREMLKKMQPGTVMVDVSVDQGGCAETTRPTTHHDPVYIVDGIVHYCVANMPGAVPRSASLALNHATLPFGLEIANNGLVSAVQSNEAIYNGVNTYQGYLVYPAVGEALNIDSKELSDLL